MYLCRVSTTTSTVKVFLFNILFQGFGKEEGNGGGGGDLSILGEALYLIKSDQGQKNV